MPPTCFGRYILLDRLAAGGMGEVFTAVPISLWGFDKFFALKRMLPGLGDNEEFLQRFRDEVQLVLPMNHPNVVQVFEVGRVGAEFFIVMELVEGRDLQQITSRLTRWRQPVELPLPAALYLVRELLAGLDYCHQHKDALGRELGVVHRDVCPANLLVSFDGAVKLADFGLALSELKLARTDPRLLLGHAGYIAPEALDQVGLDHRADIYAAGVILFELLTGQRFIATADLGAIYNLKQVRARTRPSELRAEIPRAVDELVARSVAFDPAERFATARQFHDEVQRQLAVIDPVYGGHALAETVMSRYFRPEERRRRLRALVQGVDIEGLLARQLQRQPGAQAGGDAPESVLQGDTEPMPIQALLQLELPVPAASQVVRPCRGSWPRLARPRWSARASRTSSYPTGQPQSGSWAAQESSSRRLR